MAYVRQSSWVESGPGPVAPPSGCGIQLRKPAAGSKWRRRGVGDGVPYASYCANASLWNPIAWSVCLPADVSAVGSKLFGVSSVSAPLPPAPPAGISLVTGASAASSPGAVFAGNDSSGNPIYAVPQTADANMAAYQATLNTFMSNLDTSNNPPVDCSSGWNQFTNSACGGSWLPIVAGVGLLGALVLLGGGRRR
jgi:hypothetical protein